MRIQSIRSSYQQSTLKFILLHTYISYNFTYEETTVSEDGKVNDRIRSFQDNIGHVYFPSLA